MTYELPQTLTATPTHQRTSFHHRVLPLRRVLRSLRRRLLGRVAGGSVRSCVAVLLR